MVHEFMRIEDDSVERRRFAIDFLQHSTFKEKRIVETTEIFSHKYTITLKLEKSLLELKSKIITRYVRSKSDPSILKFRKFVSMFLCIL